MKSTFFVVVAALLSFPTPARSQEATLDRCRGGLGGGGPMSEAASLVMSLEIEGEEVRINALVVVRHDAPIDQSRGPNVPPPPFPQWGSGGSVDTLLVVYDDPGRVWLHTRPVELGDNNVLLVDRNARAGGVPTVVKAFRIEPRLAIPGSGCAAPPHSRRTFQAIRSHILDVPEIAAFLDESRDGAGPGAGGSGPRPTGSPGPDGA